jgi:hypothetical protein
MRTHRHYQRLLARSDELTAHEREQLLAHLATCTRCRQEHGAQRTQDEILRRFADAQPPVSLQAAVLVRIREDRVPVPVELNRPRVRRVPAAAGLLLAACLLLVAGLTLGQRFLLPPARPSAVAVRGNCAADDADWVLKGPCQILDSPEVFRRPGVTFYPLALQWAKKHLHQPHYVVRKNTHLPVVIGHGSPVYFSEIAVDRQAHVSMYIVGNN